MKNCAVALLGSLSPGHRNCAAFILETVFGFVNNRRTGRFLLHIRGKAAALNHKIGLDPVEYRSIVKTILNILQKIGGRYRGSRFVDFDYYCRLLWFQVLPF